MLVTNLSDEVRKAVNEAFDAISNWRSETLSNSEKNSGQVLEKMAPAGWNSGSDIEQQPQTSAKLSYLARYCLFKALQYDLLGFWLAGGEGKRSSDGMEEHICNRHCLHSM